MPDKKFPVIHSAWQTVEKLGSRTKDKWMKKLFP